MTARRLRLTAEERRRQILEKACEIFSVRGLTGARTRDIADACGINEALLYKHFKSKEDLFRQAAMLLYGNLRQNWLGEAAKASDGLDGLQRWLRSELALLTGNPRICGILWHAIASSNIDNEAREMATGWFLEHQAATVELLEKGVKDGSIRPGLDPERVTMVLRGVVWMHIVKIMLGLHQDTPGMLKLVEDFVYSRLSMQAEVQRNREMASQFTKEREGTQGRISEL